MEYFISCRIVDEGEFIREKSNDFTHEITEYHLARWWEGNHLLFPSFMKSLRR